MKIYIRNETNNYIHSQLVHEHVSGSMHQLFTPTEREQISVYVIITDKRIPRQTALALGSCGRVADNVFRIYVKVSPSMGITVRHEVFHIMQFRDQLPLDEKQCEQFALLDPSVLDA